MTGGGESHECSQDQLTTRHLLRSPRRQDVCLVVSDKVWSEQLGGNVREDGNNLARHVSQASAYSEGYTAFTTSRLAIGDGPKRISNGRCAGRQVLPFSQSQQGPDCDHVVPGLRCDAGRSVGPRIIERQKRWCHARLQGVRIFLAGEGSLRIVSQAHNVTYTFDA